MKTVIYGTHKIEIDQSSLTGKEEVIYDGKVVSYRHAPYKTTHIFQVKEDGEDVQYEVELSPMSHLLSFWAIVRRNGKVIYNDR